MYMYVISIQTTGCLYSDYLKLAAWNFSWSAYSSLRVGYRNSVLQCRHAALSRTMSSLLQFFLSASTFVLFRLSLVLIVPLSCIWTSLFWVHLLIIYIPDWIMIETIPCYKFGAASISFSCMTTWCVRMECSLKCNGCSIKCCSLIFYFFVFVWKI